MSNHLISPNAKFSQLHSYGDGGYTVFRGGNTWKYSVDIVESRDQRLVFTDHTSWVLSMADEFSFHWSSAISLMHSY